MSEKMIFCLGEGKWKSEGIGYQQNHMIFNQKVTDEEYQSTLKLLRENDIKIQLTKWTEYKDLDKSEQTTTAKQIDGLLKTFTYQDAWANFWKEATQKQKDCITSIKQFDAEIFKGITGIDVEQEVEELTLEEVCKQLGKTVKIIK
jgi:hypothetical protein